jgi:putative tricarboxylic transport membrane protein
MLSISRRPILRLVAAGTLSLLAWNASPASAEVKGLEILAPSSPGSGYDQLARAMQTTLQEEKLASAVQVENIAGGGGTVGLAKYVTTKKRAPNVMIVGFALVGGILTTQSQVTLEQTAPLARLVGEQDVIVVPENSDIRTMADLVAKMKENPGSVSWGGGSIGGVDHVLVGLIAKAAGVDPTKINFVVHAGGGEVLASALGGHVTSAVSGYNELSEQIRAGKLRALAVSGEERLPGLDAPTLRETGVDVALVNWRGLVTTKDIRPADRKALTEAVDKMVKSPIWQEALQKRGWQDLYQPSEGFTAFLAQQQVQIKTALQDVGLVK